MHTHIFGQSRVGKSTLMASKIIADINADNGVLVLDPHGTLIDDVLAHFPKRRLKEAIYFDVSDLERPIAFNPFYGVEKDSRPLLARAIVSTFRDVWDYGRTPTPDIDLAVYNGSRVMLDTPDGTLLGLFLMLIDPAYRKAVVEHCKDPVISRYFHFFKSYDERVQKDKERSTLNKLEILLADPYARNILGQYASAIDLLDIMDTNKCLFVRLPQGHLGIEGTKALGSLILTTLHHQARKRSTNRRFGVYLDECHLFGSHTLCEMLSGIGKTGLDLTLAHQYLAQLTDELKASIFGNCSTRYVFRVGMDDAVELHRVIPEEQVRPNFDVIEPFTARVFTHTELKEHHVEKLPPGNPFDDIVRWSRGEYGKNRKDVEESIERFLERKGGRK